MGNYQGSLSREDVFSIHLKSRDWYYELRVPWASMVRKASTKTLLKTELARKLIAKFETEIVTKHKAHGLMLFDNIQTSKILNYSGSNRIQFRSSWGVGNSVTHKLNFNLNEFSRK